MKLTEAIRLGGVLNKQGVGAYRDGDSTCTLGGIAVVLGIKIDQEYEENVTAALAERFPVLNKMIELTPYLRAKIVEHGFEETSISVSAYIARLNDTGYFTREQIAQWVSDNGYDQEDQLVNVSPAVSSPAVLPQAEAVPSV